MSTATQYQVNGQPVSVSRYAEVTTQLLADALDFRRRVEAWHQSVGGTDERALDPFVMWLHVGDLLHGHEVIYDRTEPAHIGGCNKNCREGNHWLRDARATDPTTPEEPK